jgi:23S rRNA (pseudouridine1915-N3)-methyltransferase
VRITVVAVGKLKERWWREAADEYLKRLRPYATVKVIEVPDRDVTRDEERALAEEGADILKALRDTTHVIALDAGGTAHDSVTFSDALQQHGLAGRSDITFVIGGSAGSAADVLARADETLSLGAMTLPHQLARVVLLEQLYRAFKIARGEPYHR